MDYNVNNDSGGVALVYIVRGAKQQRAGNRIVINGKCTSACTFYLFYPNTCVTHKADLVFHQTTNPRMTKYVMSKYPLRIRKWLKRQGGLTKKLIHLRGKELFSLVRQC